jgi:O-antigen ligase
MTAYGVVCVSSLLYALQPELTSEALLNYVDGLFIVAVVALNLRTRDDLRRTVWAIVVAGFVLSGLTVLQQVAGLHEQTFGGFAHVEMRNIHSRTAGFRSEGPVSANYFALVLVVVVPLAVDRMLHGVDRLQRGFAGLTAALAVSGVYFTYSRGGLVALAVTMLPMLAWVPRRVLVKTAAWLALPLAVGLSYMASSEYGQRIMALGQLVDASAGNAPQDNALAGRISEVTSAAMMFQDHPLLGVGVGNYEVHYHRYAQQVGLDARHEERQAHSLYLEVAAESGLLGLGVFGSMLLYAAVGPWRARKRLLGEGDLESAHYMTALGVAFFGYLVGSLFLHLSYPRYFWLMLGLAMGSRQWVPAARGLAMRRRLVVADRDAPGALTEGA